MTTEKTSTTEELKSGLDAQFLEAAESMEVMYQKLRDIIHNEMQEVIDETKPKLFAICEDKKSLPARVLWDLTMNNIKELSESLAFEGSYASEIVKDFTPDTDSDDTAK